MKLTEESINWYDGNNLPITYRDSNNDELVSTTVDKDEARELIKTMDVYWDWESVDEQKWDKITKK